MVTIYCRREIDSFRLGEIDIGLQQILVDICGRLMKDLDKNSIRRREYRNKGKDVVEFSQYIARNSKPIIDEIDCVLGKHYGFTEEELDFIINYDIKYRMGKDNEEE